MSPACVMPSPVATCPRRSPSPSRVSSWSSSRKSLMEWSTNSVSLQGRSLVSHRKSAQKGTFQLQSVRFHRPSLLSRHSKLGGQALVLDVEGTWRELTGVVNKLAANLTNQVRNIARVTTAVARGDIPYLICEIGGEL